MSREKSEKVCITFRLSEEEHEKLKQYSSACGLSAAEFMRQLCRGNAPQPMPQGLETAPENHGNLSVVLLLVLSVGDIPERHGLQADKPADERGASETGRDYRTGTLYVRA